MPEYLMPMVRHYQASRMGGDSIQWQTGNWGDMPLLIVESFAELSVGIREGSEYKRKSDESKAGLAGSRGFRGKPNPNRKRR